MSTMKLNLIIVGVVVTLTAGFAAGLLIPGVRDLDQARQEVADKLAVVQTEQQQVGNVSELYSSILQMDVQLTDFRKRLPEDRQFGEFLNDLSENLKRNQIDEYIVQPRPARPLDETKLPADRKLAKDTVILPVSVAFETSFTKLFEFLKSMEAMPRLYHVESLKVVNDEQRPGTVKVELGLQTYHRPS